MSLLAALHLVLHVAVPAAVPAAVAYAFYRPRWRRARAVMLATMLVDLDHLLADPVYDPGRCSIGFHPLHTAPVIVFYGLLFAWPRARLVGLGLLIHMALDALDCAFM